MVDSVFRDEAVNESFSIDMLLAAGKIRDVETIGFLFRRHESRSTICGTSVFANARALRTSPALANMGKVAGQDSGTLSETHHNDRDMFRERSGLLIVDVNQRH